MTPRDQKIARHAASLTIVGFLISIAIIFPLHGSRWPTAFFVMAGTVLPVPLGHLLSHIPRPYIRWPGLLSLFLTTLTILIIALLGKYPNPANAFKNYLGITPPASVRNLSALCGWNDGRITIVRFTSDGATIRKLLPPGTETELLLGSMGPGLHDEDDRWSVATMPGWIVDRSLATFPGWHSAWRAEWNLPSYFGEPHFVRIVWDDQTGQAILVAMD